MNKSKAAIVVSQIIEKLELILGGLWAFMFILVAIVSMFDDSADGVGTIIAIWILGALGVWVFLKGRRRKKMRLEFKKYVAELSVDPTGSIENIAAATGMPVDVVKKNLNFMIKKKFFSNAYIDEANNRLVIPTVNENSQTNVAQPIGNTSAQIVYKTCNCPNCGGVNKVAQGSVAECDFCGSVIQG